MLQLVFIIFIVLLFAFFLFTCIYIYITIHIYTHTKREKEICYNWNILKLLLRKLKYNFEVADYDNIVKELFRILVLTKSQG